MRTRQSRTKTRNFRRGSKSARRRTKTKRSPWFLRGGGELDFLILTREEINNQDTSIALNRLNRDFQERRKNIKSSGLDMWRKLMDQVSNISVEDIQFRNVAKIADAFITDNNIT